MDNAQGVRGFQRAADLLHQLDCLFRRKLLLFLDQRAQILALHKLHGDELHTIGIAQIEDSDDVSVSYLAREQKLLLEPRQDRGIGSEFGTDQL